MLTRLTFMLHFMISTTLMGILVTAALATRHDSAVMLMAAAAVGFLVALPVSWLVARKITHLAKS